MAANPSCPDELKAFLAKDTDQQVIMALLKNPQAPGLSVFDEIVRDGQAQTLEMLATDAKTPPAILKKLSEIPNQTEFLLLSLARIQSATRGYAAPDKNW